MQTSFICETEEPQKEMTSFENVSHTLFIPAPLIQNHNAQWSGNDDFFFFFPESMSERFGLFHIECIYLCQ